MFSKTFFFDTKVSILLKDANLKTPKSRKILKFA